ncbi:22451_t:CDS:1 [Dentiscutata erythropus]|uniref:22451_t:CDS:1 n=1 Tax=Dentiscutata erythropus TaxID=1348616 RepID=A0A9N9NWW0_9GLOM|nr:22451_t:CDS:1 [Dentiscutata erythropus]
MAEDKPVKSLEDNSEIVTYGMFDDTLFPDNKNRLRRANELQNDIKLFVIELVNKKEKLDSLLETLKKKLDHISEKLDIPKIQYIEKEVYEDSFFWFPKTIEFVLDFIIFRKAYHHAFKFWSLKLQPTINIPNPDIPSQSFSIPRRVPRPVPDPKIPPLQKLWFTLKWNGRVFSTVISGFVTVFVAIGIDLIISSYTGAQRRKEMQNFIKECREPCIELYHDMMVLDLIIEQINGFIIAIDIVEYKNPSKNELQEMFKIFQDKCNEKIHEIDYSKADKVLKETDEQRGSWTNEG